MAKGDAETRYHENSILISSFITWLLRHKIAQESTRAYAADVQRFLKFIEPPISYRDPAPFDHVNHATVAAYSTQLVECGLQSSTVKRNLMAVRKFFDFLIQQKQVATNPAAEIRPLHGLKDLIPTDKLTEVFQYLSTRQASTDGSASLRYHRDELILISLVLLGVRIYQIPTLRLSSITQTGSAICLRVSERLTVDLHSAFLIKLRTYLTLRGSRVDILFLEPGTKKPVTSKSLHALLVEIGCALHLDCTPASLFHTYLHLHSSPKESGRVWDSLGPTSRNSTLREITSGH